MQSWGLFQTRVCWTTSLPSQETRLGNRAQVTHPQFSPSGLAYHQYLANSSPVSRRVNSWIWRSSYQTVWAFTTTPSLLSDKDVKQPFKTKRRQVTNITEWVQCYSIYVAVLTSKYPDKIQDLMGYQALIIEACMEYGSEAWLGYDRRFRQMAAASPGTQWAKIDPTLWNMAFTGQAKAHRCKYCFSLTHQAEECDWAPTPSSAHPKQAANPSSPRGAQRPRTLQVCYSWNHSPDPNCTYPGCKYQHICLYCAKDPQAPNKDHKALHCNRRRRSTSAGSISQPSQASAVPSNPSPANYRYQPY